VRHLHPVRARSLGVVLSALAFGAYLMLATVPAQAAVTCSYDAVNRQVNIDATAPGDRPIVGRAPNGDIVFDDDGNLAGASPCGTATVNNTDGIDIDDLSGGSIEVTIDLQDGPLGPGETPEGSGISEIEIDVAFDSNGVFDDLVIGGSSDDDTIVVDDG